MALGSSPFHGRFPRDGLAHHVGATAEGYDAKLEDVTFAGDLSIDVSLDRHAPPAVHWIAVPAPAHSGKHATGSAAAAPPAADPVPPPSPSPPAPARTDVGPAGGRAPLRPIMTSNPYGTP